MIRMLLWSAHIRFPRQLRPGTPVVFCIGRRVTGGRAARTGMPLLRRSCTPPQNPLYIFRRRPKTLLQLPNGIFRVTRSSCGGRVSLLASVPSDGPRSRLRRGRCRLLRQPEALYCRCRQPARGDVRHGTGGCAGSRTLGGLLSKKRHIYPAKIRFLRLIPARILNAPIGPCISCRGRGDGLLPVVGRACS